MRMTASAILMAVVSGAFAAEPAATSPANPLAGFWKPQSILYEGQQQIDAKAAGAITLVIKDGEYRMYYCSDPAKDLHYRLFTADLKLDPQTRTFELFVKDGQKKGERRHGIYEHSGSTLKLCYGPTDKARPTTFDAPKDSGYFCETWTVEKR